MILQRGQPETHVSFDLVCGSSELVVEDGPSGTGFDEDLTGSDRYVSCVEDVMEGVTYGEERSDKEVEVLGILALPSDGEALA